MKTTLTSVFTFVAATAVGCAAAIAIASTAVITHELPTLRPASVKTVPQEVIRLEPVVVTISKSSFEAARKEMSGDTQMARDNSGKARHG